VSAAGAVRISFACTGCGACLTTCPERALLRAPRRPVVVASRCTACLACVEVCPVDAISEGPGPGAPPEVEAA
jgi:ferredoxin